MKKIVIALALVLGLQSAPAQITNINIGTNPNDGTGDPLRTAFTKINSNIAYIEAQVTNAATGTNVGLLNGTNAWAGSGSNYFAGPLVATNASNVVSGKLIGNGAGVTNLPTTAMPALGTNAAQSIAVLNMNLQTGLGDPFAAELNAVAAFTNQVGISFANYLSSSMVPYLWVAYGTAAGQWNPMQLPATNVSGTLPVINGGTGTNTARGAGATTGIFQMSQIGGGSFSDFLLSAPSFEGQPGLAYYGNKTPALFFGGSTTQGDWLHAGAAPTGLAQIGDADYSDPQFVNMVIGMAGNTNNWLISGGSDTIATFKTWCASTGNSGSGINLAVMTVGYGLTGCSAVSLGSGYKPGDILTIPTNGASGFGGNNSPNPSATLLVLATNGSGGITRIVARNSGEYYTHPSGTITPTGGSGSGFTATLSWMVRGINYMADNSCSFMHVPTNRPSTLIPGNAMLVFNRDSANLKGLAICGPSFSGFDSGNYSTAYFDFKNGLFRIPYWVSGAYQPSDSGWLDTFEADPSTGNVYFKGLLYSGAKGATVGQLTTSLGLLNGAALDPNNGVSVTNIHVLMPLNSTGISISGGYMTLGTTSGGEGFIGDNSGPLVTISESGNYGAMRIRQNGINFGWINAGGGTIGSSGDSGYAKNPSAIYDDGPMLATGLVTGNGFASTATTTAVITSTGWTNASAGNMEADLVATSATYILYNNAGMAVFTNSSFTGAIAHIVQPGGKITASSGLAGAAHAY